jgi:hypothetical protein
MSAVGSPGPAGRHGTRQRQSRGYPKIFRVSLATREVGQIGAIDTEPSYRQNGRLRDIISAAEVYTELNEYLAAGVARSGLDLLQLFPTPEDARRFSDGMPSTRVAVSLKTHFHKNKQHNWNTHDMHDIDALAVAMPYCDAVFTDNAVWNALTSSPELNVFGTERWTSTKPSSLAAAPAATKSSEPPGTRPPAGNREPPQHARPGRPTPQPPRATPAGRCARHGNA